MPYGMKQGRVIGRVKRRAFCLRNANMTKPWYHKTLDFRLSINGWATTDANHDQIPAVVNAILIVPL